MTSKDKAGILPTGAGGIGGGGGAGAAFALALARALAAGCPSLPLLRPVRHPILAHMQWLAHRSSLQRGRACTAPGWMQHCPRHLGRKEHPSTACNNMAQASQATKRDSDAELSYAVKRKI